MILYALYTIIAYFIYTYFIKSLWILLIYKLKHGSKINGIYFPLIPGLKDNFLKSYELYNCPYKMELQRKLDNPSKFATVYTGAQFPLISLFDPDHIKQWCLLDTNDFQKFIPFFYFKFLFKDGLLFTNGEQWKRQRNSLKNEFTFEKLRGKFSGIKKIASSVLEGFLTRQRSKNIQQPVRILNLLTDITGEVIFQAFFGGQQNIQINKQLLSQELAEIIVEIGEATWKLSNIMKSRIFGREYYQYDILLSQKQKKLKNRILNFKKTLGELIEQKLSTLDQDKESQYIIETMLKDYLKNKEKIQFDELIQQFFTFFFAGMDTASTTLAFAFYLLAKHPEVLHKLNEEISTMPDNLQFESLSQMNYMTAVLKETLRIYPVVGGYIPRKPFKNTKIGEILIKKDSPVYILNMVTHNDIHFENADQFIPERWLQKQNYHPFAYTPFLAGPRNCIGQHLATIEMRVTLFTFLKKVQPRINKNVEFGIVQGMVCKPKNEEIIYLDEIK